MNDPLKPELLRVREACRISAQCLSRGYELIHRGEWPHVRIGRSIRVPYSGLMQWISSLSADEDEGSETDEE